MKDALDWFDPVQECPTEWVTDFHTASCVTAGVTVVRAYGEIDMATGDMLRAALTAGLDPLPPLLVVDLGGVSFLDAYGLGILVCTANRADQAGVPITVIGARPHVHRLFELTGLVDRLAVRPRTAAGTPRPGRPAPTVSRPGGRR